MSLESVGFYSHHGPQQRSVADAIGPTSKKVDGFLYLDARIREKTVSR